VIEAYRTPDARFDRLPGYEFEPRYATVDGLRLHYVDEGAGAPVLQEDRGEAVAERIARFLAET
jgi:hypothetical protein